MATKPVKAVRQRLKLIQSQVTLEQYDQIKKIADDEARSMSSVVVLAVRAYLEARREQHS